MVKKSKVDAILNPKGEESPTRRAKSPSRGVKSKSPGRKGKSAASPNRRSRSPARVKKSAPADKERNVNEVPAKKTVSRSKKVVVTEIDTDSDGFEYLNEIKLEKPKAAVRGRARKLDIGYSAQEDEREIVSDRYLGVARRSTRLANALDIDRIVQLKQDTLTEKLTEFSDDDIVNVKDAKPDKSDRYSEAKSIPEKQQQAISVGVSLLALLGIIALPLSVIAMQIICNKAQCSFIKKPNLAPFKSLSKFIDLRTFITYSGLVLIVEALSLLPFGGRKVAGMPNKQGKFEYRMNGIFTTAIVVAVAILLEFFNIRVLSDAYENYLKFAVASIVWGMAFAVYVYVRSFFIPVSALNPHAITSSKVYNFFMGREVSPRVLGRIDLKICFYRICCIAVLIINLSIIYKSLTTSTKPLDVKTLWDWKSLNVQPTLLLISTLQSIYVLDCLIFESTLLTTFEIQYEGVGYMSCVGFLSAPWLLTLIPKHVLDHNTNLATWKLAACTVVFILGFFLYRASNAQKDAFRKNPYHPQLAHLESIPTSQGKKLLVSGYWGFVRHPNYLGDILLNLSWVPFVMCVPPVTTIYATIALLIHRSVRDGKRCQRRYGPAWDRYCQRVKYVLIPKVY